VSLGHWERHRRHLVPVVSRRWANIDRSATGVAGLGGGLHRRIDGFAHALEH
jgi:hypothetical protein